MNQGATGRWYSAADPTTNTTVDGFSATCYFTAIHLKRSLPAFATVPIGLVRSSVGGQVIERFMSIEAMEAVGVPPVNATNVSCGQSSHTLYDSLSRLQPTHTRSRPLHIPPPAWPSPLTTARSACN